MKLKRLVRYLVHNKRVAWHFNFEERSDVLDVFSDTDPGGCHRTRRSTSGGVMMLGGHCVRHWSSTQPTLALSSAEAELRGIAKGSANALGVRSIARDVGLDFLLRILSDAAAAIGLCVDGGLAEYATSPRRTCGYKRNLVATNSSW